MQIRVVAAAVVQQGRLLIASKRVAPDVFYLPGGKPDGDEPERTTLPGELVEELCAEPMDAMPYLVVEAMAALERVPMRLSVYRCTLSAAPRRAAEIAKTAWTSGVDAHVEQLAPAIRHHVVPRLLADGLLGHGATA